MQNHQEPEKREDRGRDFDALLRARLAANSLTPRVRSYLEPEREEVEADTATEGEQA
jgi:hypothetical protein